MHLHACVRCCAHCRGPPLTPGVWCSRRYLEVGGGHHFQDSQFMTLIKEEPEDVANVAAAGGGGAGSGSGGRGTEGSSNGTAAASGDSAWNGGANGGGSGGNSEEAQPSEVSQPSPDPTSKDNSTSIVSALAGVRELYSEHP